MSSGVWNYPRWRGEQTFMMVPMSASMELPPLARGTVRLSTQNGWDIRNYPRWRGEQSLP